MDSMENYIKMALSNLQINFIDNNEMTQTNESIFSVPQTLSDYERIKYVIGNIKPGILEEGGTKNIELSMLHKKRGDDYLSQSYMLDDALEEYTKCIAYAPPDSCELATAYNERSKLLFKSKLITDCLLDINRALDNPNSDHVKANLYYLKANCIQALNPNDQDKYNKSLELSRKWIDNINNNNDKKILFKNLKQQKFIKPIVPVICHKLKSLNPPKLNGENLIVPGLSDSTVLKYSKKFGRYIEASRDISTGEVIGMQKPYAKIVSKNMKYKMCWNCGKQTWSTVQCNECANVIYCSIICRDNGYTDYHDIECFVMKKIYNLKINDVCIIGLRLTIMALKDAEMSIDKLKKNINKFDSVTDPLKKGMIDDKFQSDKFSSVHSLSSNFIEKNSLEFSIISSSSFYIAYFIAIKIGFINVSLSNICTLKDNDDFIFLVEFVEKNNCLTKLNGFTIELPYSQDTPTPVAKAVLPSFSLFNHSCSSMMTRSYHDGSMVTTSLCPIKKGQQIFFSYGPSYARTSKIERQEFYKKNYGFTCSCEPCINNWPFQKPEFVVNEKNYYYIEIIQDKIIDIRDKIVKTCSLIDNYVRKNNQLMDLSKDTKNLIEFIEQYYNILDKNSSELFLAQRLLENYTRLAQIRLYQLD